MTIPPTATLRIADDLHVRCRSASEFTLELGPRVFRGGPHTLSILGAFRRPTGFAAVLEALKPQLTGVHDWMELVAEVSRFYEQGALVEVGPARPAAGVSARDARGFAGAPIHIAMLRDRERTLRFLDAIARTVRPGDVVVDLGTGSGLLSVAAARAGASRVYAIEATGIARVAERVFAANDVADRITLLEGHSTRLELPERADVLIAEIIGSDPLEEKILEATCDAVRRFLKPDARLVPRALELVAAPVELPADVRDRAVVSAAMLEAWRRDYGIDFSPLEALSRDAAGKQYERQEAVARWARLAEPRALAAFDLALAVQPPYSMAAEFEVTRAGLLGAVVLWFNAVLCEGVVLSTDPRAPRPDNHWSHPVYLLPEALEVRPGARAGIALPRGDDRAARVTLAR